MRDNRRTKLAATIVVLYRTHWRLFWRIMLPVAIIAIALSIAQFFQIRTPSEPYIGNTPSRHVYTFTSNVNTVGGIEPSVVDTTENRTTGSKSSSRVDWQLYPYPSFRSTNSEGVTWKWDLKFRVFENTLLILMLLTICPLSLAVAHISRSSQVSDNIEELSLPTPREMWRRTGRNALGVFVAGLLFILIVDAIVYLYGLASWLMPSLVRGLPFELYVVLITVPSVYFMVILSLYNQCLIFENNSIIGIFRRSYTLVSGARWRFLGIYLLTGWVAAVISSVLLGAALLLFSVFVPELTQVREALFSPKFLTFFIGADVEVVLPEILNVPATVAILVVKGLIATFLVPIWAILTTLLYLERVGVKPYTIKEAA